MSHERFLAAAQRVLDGDDSIQAANQLEVVVLDDYPGDERFNEVVYLLSLYSPGDGRPYSAADEVRTAIRHTMASID